MVNPILQAMQKTITQQQTPTINNPVIQLINNVKNSSNPEQMIFNMAQSNPQVASIINQAAKNGQSYKDLFYSAAQARGINPEQIISLLR